MTIKRILEALNQQMKSLEINYSLSINNKKPIEYPYWIGQPITSSIPYEDSMEQHIIVITGFHRGNRAELIEQLDKIKKHFKNSVKLLSNNFSIVFSISNFIADIPTADPELIKAEITLEVKCWCYD